MTDDNIYEFPKIPEPANDHADKIIIKISMDRNSRTEILAAEEFALLTRDEMGEVSVILCAGENTHDDLAKIMTEAIHTWRE